MSSNYNDERSNRNFQVILSSSLDPSFFTIINNTMIRMISLQQRPLQRTHNSSSLQCEFSLNIFWLYNGAKAINIQQKPYMNFESDLWLVCEI